MTLPTSWYSCQLQKNRSIFILPFFRNKKKTLTTEQTFQHCTSKPGSKIPSIDVFLKSTNLLCLVTAHLIPSACYVTYSALFGSLPVPTPHSVIPKIEMLQFKARVPSKLTSRAIGFAKANRESSQEANIGSVKSSHSCKSGLWQHRTASHNFQTCQLTWASRKS